MMLTAGVLFTALGIAAAAIIFGAASFFVPIYLINLMTRGTWKVIRDRHHNWKIWAVYIGLLLISFVGMIGGSGSVLAAFIEACVMSSLLGTLGILLHDSIFK